MPKIPYKAEKSRGDEEDYEIVSFEDFCDKGTESKNDSSLNDNINYRLCYENVRRDSLNDKELKDHQDLKETSLNDGKNAKIKTSGFAPFGRSQPRCNKKSLFSSVIHKGKIDAEATTRDHRSVLNCIFIYIPIGI